MNKNILVTGGAKGLGLEITRSILNSGNNIFVLSRSEPVEFIKLKEENKNRLYFLKYDLKNTDSLKQFIYSNNLAHQIPIHGLVNNSAIAYDDIITNLNVLKLDEMFKVNVYAPMILIKYIIRNMLLHRIKGSIVNISSVSVHTGYKGLSMYASSKGALEALSKNVAREWGGRGIRSNCIAAGFMETHMSQELSQEQINRIKKRTSLKELTSLQSVAETCNFLLNNESSSITGQTIHVDSGTI